MNEKACHDFAVACWVHQDGHGSHPGSWVAHLVGDKAALEAAKDVENSVKHIPYESALDYAQRHGEVIRDGLHYPTGPLCPRHDECPGAPRCQPWEDYP